MYHTWHDAKFSTHTTLTDSTHTTLTDSTERCSMELQSGQICIVPGMMQIKKKKIDEK